MHAWGRGGADEEEEEEQHIVARSRRTESNSFVTDGVCLTVQKLSSALRLLKTPST